MKTHFAEKTTYRGDKCYMSKCQKKLSPKWYPCRGDQSCAAETTKTPPTRPKYFADASKDFADASKIFRRRVQGFRRRVQRFHRRRGNAADATSYHGNDCSFPHLHPFYEPNDFVCPHFLLESCNFQANSPGERHEIVHGTNYTLEVYSGVTYVFTVVAINAIGRSPEATPITIVTPVRGQLSVWKLNGFSGAIS